MSAVKKTVLIVDDTNDHIELMCGLLKDHYRLLVAKNGEDAITLAQQEPDIILLDVVMPGISGYLVCETLRQDELTAQIPVVFISGADSEDERLRGYEAGGNDFLVKPISGVELLKKIEIILNQQDTFRGFKRAADSLALRAEAAIGQADVLQLIVTYTKSVMKCQSMDELAEKLLGVLAEMGLQCVVEIPSIGESIIKTNDKILYPLESYIIHEMRGRGRIYEFGCRTCFNWPNITLLVKNMPIEDSSAYEKTKSDVEDVLDMANEMLSCKKKISHIHRRNEVVEQAIEEMKFALRNEMKRQQDWRAKEEKLENEVNDFFRKITAEEQLDSEESADFNEAFKNLNDMQKNIIDSGIQANERFDKMISSLKDMLPESDD